MNRLETRHSGLAPESIAGHRDSRGHGNDGIRPGASDLPGLQKFR
jgi:hypothetical protein